MLDFIPEQKVDILDKLDLQKVKMRGSLVFVEDGINDAPALARGCRRRDGRHRV